MGFFDSITSLFEDTPAPPEEVYQEPAPPLYRAQDMLSTHYSLGNLTATNQSLSQPNYPTSSEHMDNLTYLADMLERLDQEIGPFQILSGYRTRELQNKLSAAGEPTASGTSFHEIGRAVDITPTSMSLTDYFGRILANEDLKNQFAEIAIKASQNALHLSVNVPSDSRTPKVLGLNTAGVYARLNLDEIANYISPFMQSAEDAYDYAAAKLVSYDRTPLILGVVAAVGGVLYLALAKGQRTARNPRDPVKPFKKFGHLSTKKLHKMMEQLADRIEPDALLSSLNAKGLIPRITNNKEKKLINLFDEIGDEIIRRETQDD